jgi:hypothetical protein
MKVTGPGSQTPTGAAEEAKAPQTTEGPSFSDKLDRAGAPKPSASAGGAAKTSAPGGKMTGDIAAALARKDITPETAVDQVVNRILDKQVGASAGTKSATRASVENALRDAIETDPVLQAKVKSLAD